MNRFLVTAVLAGALAGGSPAADLKSGLQPGQPVPVFHPLLVTGPSAGEKQCPV